MKKITLLLILIAMVSLEIVAQNVYENRTYSPLIRTVMLKKADNLLSLPVIYLNRNDYAVLSFDELSEETKRYEFTLIHCNSDWTPSGLPIDLYIEGFEIGQIENYSNSEQTIQRYVHYSQMIPSKDMRILKSGNYIIKVFQEGNPDNVVLTRRLYVVDDKANVEVSVTPSKDASLLRTHQEVNVRIGAKNGSYFSSAEQYMTVTVMQNGREDNKRNLRLRGMMGDKLDYSFYSENQFAAGNEFRYFDFTSLRIKSQYIDRFDYINDENQVYLRTDKPRNDIAYSSEKDLNGSYYIRNDINENYSVGSDYAWVHFTLDKPLSLEGAYYVVGSMTDWRLSVLNQMKYENNAYHLALYLKQGYYNYQILYKRPNEKIASTKEVEGNHSETNNKYNVFVYYKNFADNYDELVGYSTVEYNR